MTARLGSAIGTGWCGSRPAAKVPLRASVRSPGEGVEDAVAELDLLIGGERSMPEDALVELAGLTGSAASVCEREVVEDEQLTGTEADVDLNAVKRQAPLREELTLVGQAANSVPQRKPG